MNQSRPDTAMSSPTPPSTGSSHNSNVGLWITVIVEGIMIIAVAIFNIVEIRRSGELVRSKIEHMSEYSARQGEKLDRIVTALELYVGKKFPTNDTPSTNALGQSHNPRIDKAIQFLESWKTKGDPTGRSDLPGSPTTP